MKKIIVFIVFLVASNVFAQHNHYILDWQINQEKLRKAKPDQLHLFQSKNYTYSTHNIYFSENWQDYNLVDVSSVKLLNTKYSPISKNIVKILNIKKIGKEFKVNLSSSYGRDIIYTSLNVNAIIKKGNQYYKLDAFDIEYSYQANQMSRNIQNIYDSKWASGKWYRFEIEESGVYKLDKKFLESLGIKFNNINPKNIKIFGNGGKTVPLSNNVSYPEDITELAIEVVGEQDSSFDNNDYILFYAQSHKEWSDDNDSNLNPYSNHTYYFVQIDNQNGKRIQSYVEPNGTVSNIYDGYQAEKFYEKDLTNFTNLGRRWYDEPLGLSNNTKNISIKFDNLIATEPVKYKVYAAGNANNTSLSVSLNGQSLGTQTLSVGSINPTTVGAAYIFQGDVNVNSNNLDFALSFNNNHNFDARMYLDYINVKAFCTLRAAGKQFVIYHPDEALFAGVGAYHFTNSSDITRIWNIDDIYNPTSLSNSASDFDVKFTLGINQKFLAIDKNNLLKPKKSNKTSMSNQNLHNDVFYHTGTFKDLDYLIITPSSLHYKAEELAQMHREIGQNTYVADLDKIYNEFGNGAQDIAAIRNFVKYIYNNASMPSKKLKYLLLFGDASFDFKNLFPEHVLTNGQNTNMVPIYERVDGFHLVSSFSSDDFFVMMDNNEGIMSSIEKPDIAVGRLVVRNEEDATNLINKYKKYINPNTKQSWHTYITLWSDDFDRPSDNFITNVENIARSINNVHPEYNKTKIYQDAYVQEMTSGGARYPDAKRDLFNTFEKGSLIIGYLGHGNEVALSHERMLELNDALNFHNFDRLPMLTTLTCEFGRYDNPTRETAAEELLWNKNGGVLSMVTTVREIWISSALTFNEDYYNTVFGVNTGGAMIKNPAEALRITKCNNANNIGRFNVAYLGDPAFELAFPNPKIVLTKVNNKPMDTLKALQKIKIEGEIRDANNQFMAGYNGTVSPIVFDKYIQKTTLMNDNEGVAVPFSKLGRKIFQGKADVVNGKFSFEFIVPKDINLTYGNGRISFYAEDRNEEKIGYDETIIVGGIDTNAEEDNQPPILKPYMNDTNFVSGGLTDESPYLLLHLEDEHGINTIGGIGHDITAYLDDNQTDVYVLNDFYETERNTYKKGKVRYRLFGIEPGWHTLTIKAWDVYNNSSVAKIDFQVVSNKEIKLEKVLNYPNPFVDYTEFWFNHNHPFETLDVMLQVYSISGKLVWQHRQSVISDGFLSREISWDGKDNFGNKLAKGVYVYKLTVRTLTGKTTTKVEKLVIL